MKFDALEFNKLEIKLSMRIMKLLSLLASCQRKFCCRDGSKEETFKKLFSSKLSSEQKDKLTKLGISKVLVSPDFINCDKVEHSLTLKWAKSSENNFW